MIIGKTHHLTSDLVDLHVHTRASDGRFQPKEVIKILNQNSIRVAALTDHETMAAYNTFTEHNLPDGMTIIPGVEFTTAFHYITDGNHDCTEVDILAYGLDPKHPDVLNLLHDAYHRNNDRLELMCQQVTQAGYPVTINDLMPMVFPQAPVHLGLLIEYLITQGHIALNEQSIAGFFADVYHKLVLPNAPPTIRTEEMIALVTQLGGVTVLAHPGKSPLKAQPAMANLEIDGVEAIHHGNNREATEYWQKIARERKLLVSYGSDFHGWFELGYTERRVEASFTGEFLSRMGIALS